jgi:hypothetical protein
MREWRCMKAKFVRCGGEGRQTATIKGIQDSLTTYPP